MNDEPYRLFDYYRYEDRDLFFGRDEEVARMVGDILSARLLALFAPSGSGKSSLLRAGVQPALEKRNFEAVFARVGEDPIASIVTALESLDSTPSRGAHDLISALTGRTKPVVVFVDQFEELFLQFSEESRQRKDFPVKLAEALFDPALRVYFVLSLRSDYFVCLNEFRDAIPTIFHNNANLELRPFDDASAHAAIVGPADRKGSGFSWEKGLPERIVRDLKARAINPGANGVLPITSQVVCHTLWSCLPHQRGEITLKSYETEGGAGTIIERRIFQTLETTPARDRRLLCRLLRELITKDGIKRPRSVKQLHEALGTAPRKRTNALLTRFQNDRLLREESSLAQTRVELRHDYLAARMKPWLEDEERRLDARRRRNNVFAYIACALVAAVCGLLWNDYHTYTAEIRSKNGQPDPEDELVVTRQQPLSMLGGVDTHFLFWRFRVETGFSRDLLQDGGIENNKFNASDAPSDWSAIGEHLEQPARARLVLATHLDSLASEPSLLPDVTALECIDIGYYAAADDKVLSFALKALEKGNPKAKSSAADALGRLGANLPPNRADKVIDALLITLKKKDTDSDVKSSVASALGRLGANLPTGRADEVVDALLFAVKDPNSNVKGSAASALGNLSANLPANRADAVVDSLLSALKDPNSDVKRSDAFALSNLGANLPANRTGAVVDALLAALKDNDSDVKRSAASALSRLAANLPAGHAATFVDALLAALKDTDSDVKRSAASALGNLRANLPAGRADAVVGELLVALEDNDSSVKSSAISALSRLAANLTAGQDAAFVDALLAALKDTDSDVKRSAASALGNLGANLPADRPGTLVDALLFALTDNDSRVKTYAASALGKLGTNLPTSRADAIVDALLSALKDNDYDVKSSAVDALGGLGANLPAHRAPAVVDALLAALKDTDSYVKTSAAAALGGLGANLPADRANAVVDALLAALKDTDSDVKTSAAAALGGLRANLPADRYQRSRRGAVSRAQGHRFRRQDRRRCRAGAAGSSRFKKAGGNSSRSLVFLSGFATSRWVLRNSDVLCLSTLYSRPDARRQHAAKRNIDPRSGISHQP